MKWSIDLFRQPEEKNDTTKEKGESKTNIGEMNQEIHHNNADPESQIYQKSSDNFKEEKELKGKEIVNKGESRYDPEDNSELNKNTKMISPSKLSQNLKKLPEDNIPRNKKQRQTSNKEANIKINNPDVLPHQNMIEYEENRNPASYEYRPEMSFGRTASGRKIPVEERTMLWKAKKESKIKNTREQIKNEDVEDCTFKPKLTSNFSNAVHNSKVINEVSSKSIEKHILRKKEIIYQQDKSKQKVSIGSGVTWKNKLTVPRLFKFQQNQEEIKSLLKPVNCANSPTKRSGRHINKRFNNNVMSHTNYIEAMNTKELLIDKNMDFQDARNILHYELMKLELENPNF